MAQVLLLALQFRLEGHLVVQDWLDVCFVAFHCRWQALFVAVAQFVELAVDGLAEFDFFVGLYFLSGKNLTLVQILLLWYFDSFEFLGFDVILSIQALT
jgi:hypothetical protein